MPDIIKTEILGNENIGLFSICYDSSLFLPYNVKISIIENIKKILNINNIYEASIAETSLLGMFLVINKNGILLPKITTFSEQKHFLEIASELGINVDIVESKITALGNTILTTDKIAIISPDFEENAKKKIEDVLDVEVITGTIADSPLVGSVAFTNGRGTLLHPLSTQEDIEFVQNNLGTKVDITTVNRGVPYPHSGIVANLNGAIVGSSTTGPETLRIFQVLFS